jgi:hypothetical protein
MTTRPHAANQIDGVVNEIGTKKDADFSHITDEIAAYHEHHPRSFNKELSRINQAFHQNPTLNQAFPDLKIVGVQDKDLIGKDKTGHVFHLDSANINRRFVDTNDHSQHLPALGQVDLKADGSGQMTVPGKGKNRHGFNDWRAAREILKAQSGQTDFNPTNNQIANYIEEMRTVNPGKNLDKLKPGETLNLPATVRRGDGSGFGDERQTDAQRALKLKDDVKAAQDRVEEGDPIQHAFQVYQKYYTEVTKAPPAAGATPDEKGTTTTASTGVTKAALDMLLEPEKNGLPGTKYEMSQETRQGLEYLRNNWDKLQDLTVKSGSTPTMTNSSFTDGMRARSDRLASLQSQLDRAEGKSIEPQSEWQADHPLAATPPAARITPVQRPVPAPQAAPEPIPVPQRPPQRLRSEPGQDGPPAPVPQRPPQRPPSEPAQEGTPAPVPPRLAPGVAPTDQPAAPPVKGHTIWDYRVPPAQQEARLSPETAPLGETGEVRAGRRVQDTRVLAQVQDATYIGLRGDITVMDRQAKQGWVRQKDQPYWLAGNAAHAFLWAQDELAKVGKQLDVSGLNGAGRLHSQEDAIRARGAFGAPSGRTSNHEVGRALDIDNWNDPDVFRVLKKAGFRQGDRHGPIGGDLHHFSFPG